MQQQEGSRVHFYHIEIRQSYLVNVLRVRLQRMVLAPFLYLRDLKAQKCLWRCDQWQVLQRPSVNLLRCLFWYLPDEASQVPAHLKNQCCVLYGFLSLLYENELHHP